MGCGASTVKDVRNDPVPQVPNVKHPVIEVEVPKPAAVVPAVQNLPQDVKVVPSALSGVKEQEDYVDVGLHVDGDKVNVSLTSSFRKQADAAADEKVTAAVEQEAINKADTVPHESAAEQAVAQTGEEACPQTDETAAQQDELRKSLRPERPSFSDVAGAEVDLPPDPQAVNPFYLASHPLMPPLAPKAPVVVVILDGFGENQYKDEFNAVEQAHTPCFDSLRANSNRFRTVQAHGKAVGLPTDDDMGNSEVGHNALGAGQIIDQGASLVDKALADGSVFAMDGFNYIKPAFEEHTLHFIGLLSDGGVHSRCNQLYQLLAGAAEHGAKKIRVHMLTDGRDVPDGSSAKYIEELEAELAKLTDKGTDVKIASGGGRMYVTMDRYEADWNIVKRGWDAHVLGVADHKFKSAADAIPALKALSGDPEKPVSDQHLEPFVIVDDDDKPVGTIEDGDAVVIFNFRADRVVELSKALEYEDFTAFDRTRFPKTRFAGLMQYDGDLKLPSNFLVPPPTISNVSGQYLCGNGLKTFACSETQKFGHVTFFWNGNKSGYINSDLETYFELKSDLCPCNEKPEMKAHEITEAGIEAILSGQYRMVRLNYANPDMVGHTGDLEASKKACEVVDECLKKVLDATDEMRGRWLVTADHGNADDMVQRTKKGEPIYVDEKTLPLTSHTLAPVPVAIGGRGLPDHINFSNDASLANAGLPNITATFINLLGLATPAGYQPSLI